MTYEKFMAALDTDDPATLEKTFGEQNGFPKGSDNLIGRFWITNAIDSGSYQVIEWMLKQGVDLNFEDEEGYTPIHSCLEREGSDRYEVLDLLIRFVADVNSHGINDWTPLHMAAVRNDFKAMEILLKAGADKTRRTRIDDFATPEEEARALGQENAARYLAQ